MLKGYIFSVIETLFKICAELIKRAGLVVAGLVADGYTTVEDASHIDRGYYKIEEDLSKLGAQIKRIHKML